MQPRPDQHLTERDGSIASIDRAWLTHDLIVIELVSGRKIMQQ